MTEYLFQLHEHPLFPKFSWFALLLLALLVPKQSFALELCREIPSAMHIEKVLPAPASGEKEKISLKNDGTEKIDLSFFQVREASGKVQKLVGELSEKASLEIEVSGISLNNDGDSLFLESQEGHLIDTFMYTKSEAGLWIWATNTETSSIETPSPAPSGAKNYDPAFLPELSEWVANPEGSDTTEEWIELWNPWDQEISLEGLWIDDQDGGSSPYALKGTMPAETYLILSAEESKISLNNSVDEVRLLGGSEKTVLWAYSYSNPKEGESFVLENGEVLISSTPTPLAENRVSHESSEESLEEGASGMSSDSVNITEVLPNPSGADAGKEWIEVFNGGDIRVNLKNWIIRTETGKEFKIMVDVWLDPQKSSILQKQIPKLSLKNGASELQLLDPWKSVKDRVQYDKAPEGKSYGKIQDWYERQETASLGTGLGEKKFKTWEWLNPTPGENNPMRYHVEGTLQQKEKQWALESLSRSWPVQEPSKNDPNLLLFQEGNVLAASLVEEKDAFAIKSLQLKKKAERSEAEVVEKKSNGFVLWLGFLMISAILYLNRHSLKTWLKNQIEKEKKESFQHNYTKDFYY